MRIAEYKIFKKAIVDALMTNDEKAPVWYAGFLWINLTQRQAMETVGILLMSDLKRDEKYVYIPSGLGIAHGQEKKNAFADWLTDGKKGGAAQMLTAYAITDYYNV